MNELKFSDIRVNMKVMDKQGNISSIVNCDKKEEILVKFLTNVGGYTFYNLEPTSKYYEPLYNFSESLQNV